MNNYDLIIIGNGFDLHCGLNSKFSDYFNYSLKENFNYRWFFKLIHSETKELFNNFNNIDYYKNCVELDDQFSAFDAMLLLMNQFNVVELWNEVETIIKNSFNDIDFSWDSVFDMVMNRNKLSELIPFSTPSKKRNEAIVAGLIIRFHDNPEHCIGFNNINDFYYFLLDQLKIFEKNFCAYLSKNIKTKESYIKNAQRLLIDICGSPSISNTSLLMSFNYTEPFGNDVPIFNIHGSVDKGEVIIGIDESGKQKCSDIFTKTFRRTLLSSKSKINFSPYFSFDDIENVYVYGHSFNKQDYSIYYYIFNQLNLANNFNKIKFHLCYSIIDNVDSSFALQINFLRMIIEYSKKINAPLLMHNLSFNSIKIKNIN